jgi:pimeloyl-ACP methyl ester carboxylesterase
MAAEPAEPNRLTMRINDLRVGEQEEEGFRPVTLNTSRGDVECRHYVGGSSAAVIWAGGAGGGWESPARGLYPKLSEEYATDGVSSLRVRFRYPGVLAESVLDVLAGVMYLADSGDDSIGVVGHSFGGAVAIQAAATLEMVRAVVTLATQSYGADPAADLGPQCALLLLHGQDDSVLSPDSSRKVHRIAQEPKQLVIFSGTGHGLDESADTVRHLTRDWIDRYVAAAAAWPPAKARAFEDRSPEGVG